MVGLLCGDVEVKPINLSTYFSHSASQSGQDFLIALTQDWCGALLGVSDAGQDKTADVPNFVSKLFVRPHLVFAERHIVAGCRTNNQREAGSIGTELFNHVERVNNVAEALAHLFAAFVSNEAVEVDVFKRYLAG